MLRIGVSAAKWRSMLWRSISREVDSLVHAVRLGAGELKKALLR